jgi:hypothetical protein
VVLCSAAATKVEADLVYAVGVNDAEVVAHAPSIVRHRAFQRPLRQRVWASSVATVAQLYP